VVTRKEVEELLEKYTAKEFYDQTLAQTELLDYRSKVIASHIWVELLLECIIVKKFKNHEDPVDFNFSKKQKIVFGLGIINEIMNNELKILNKMRNTFAHEIDPISDKIPNIVKKSKFYDETIISKTDDPVLQSGVYGMIAGISSGAVTRYLAEILWEIQSNDKK